LLSGVALTFLLAACGGSSSPSASSQAARAVQGGAPPATRSATPAQLDQALRLDQIPGIDALRNPLRNARPTAGGRQGGATPGLSIDTQDREAVRVFYNGVYSQPEAPMGWTGSYASGTAGTVSAAYQDSTLLRLNWFRAMAGVPGNATLSPENSAKDMEAALLMSYNNQLSHFPPTTWPHYTAVGADAAGHSNLSLDAGVAAISAYIREYGSNNAPVGHRRWLLYPQTTVFGSGSVPGGTVNGVSTSPANALWAYDDNLFSARPAVRDDFVAWPPRGYVPYPVVFGRWSFSYPKADFSLATLAVTKGGASIPASKETVTDGYGENTLVWLLQGSDFSAIAAKPASDQRYSVTLSNVLVNGLPRTFSYDVVVFDPAVATPGAARTTVVPPAKADAGAPFTLRLTPMAAATGYGVTQYQRQALADTAYNPANAGGIWSAQTSPGYNAIAGSSFHLYHATPIDQSLTLNKQLLPSADTTLSLTRASGYATPDEVLHLQASLDGGVSWSDLYTEAGTSHPSAEQAVQVSLAPYAGRKIQLRALVSLAPGGSYYYTSADGWRLSDIRISGSDELTNEQSYTVPAGASTDTSIAKPGDYVLFGRAQYQGRYYSDFGPAAALHVGGYLLTGPRGNYSITRNGSSYTIVDTTGKDGTQVVDNPFRLDFQDVSIAYDLDGNAGKVYRLYQAALNRQPDLAGIGYWIKVLDGGGTLEQMAASFAASGEFKGLYGSNPSQQQLITAMYNNVLHRTPDSGGYDYWLNGLNHGLSVAGLLLNFADSAENRSQTAASIADGIIYVRY
jgi:hypothetical protein